MKKFLIEYERNVKQTVYVTVNAADEAEALLLLEMAEDFGPGEIANGQYPEVIETQDIEILREYPPTKVTEVE